MSEVVPSEDSFTSAAGKQLLIFAALAIGGLALLMLSLSWASSLTGSASGGNNAVDPATNSITVFLREEPPQLNSSLSTDQVSGSVLGHVIEGLLRYEAAAVGVGRVDHDYGAGCGG